MDHQAHGSHLACSVALCPNGCVRLRIGAVSLHLRATEFGDLLHVMLEAADRLELAPPVRPGPSSIQ